MQDLRKPLSTSYTWQCRVVGVLFAVTASQAHAAYTVIDDDLLPTSMQAEAQTQAPGHYSIPFTKERSPLTAAGRALLDALLPQINGALVRIVGRPDAGTRGKVELLASNRANNIRDYLTRKGVPLSSITVEVDPSPNPQPNGSIYPSDIYLNRTDSIAPQPPRTWIAQEQQPSPPVQTVRAPSQPRTASYIPGTPSARIPPAPARAVPEQTAPKNTKSSDDALINYINKSVLSGQMDAAVALQLIRTLMEGESGANPMPASAIKAAKPAPQIAMAAPQTAQPEKQPLFVATPSLARKETWVLDKNLTLRDNLDVWSKKSGWNPTVWDASNFYQVTATSTLEGGFPDVLRQIADSTGLNICAAKKEKYVRVTDPNVACDK